MLVKGATGKNRKCRIDHLSSHWIVLFLSGDAIPYWFRFSCWIHDSVLYLKRIWQTVLLFEMDDDPHGPTCSIRVLFLFFFFFCNNTRYNVIYSERSHTAMVCQNLILSPVRSWFMWFILLGGFFFFFGGGGGAIARSDDLPSANEVMNKRVTQ